MKATVGSPQWQRRWKGQAAARDGSGTPAPSPLRPAPTPTAAAGAAAHPLVDPAAPRRRTRRWSPLRPRPRRRPGVAALEQQLAECQRALLEGRQLRLSERGARACGRARARGEVEAASLAALAAHELAAAAHADELRAALRDEATIAAQRGVLSEVVARERVAVSTLGADVRPSSGGSRARARTRYAARLCSSSASIRANARRRTRVAQRRRHAAKSGGEGCGGALELIETREAPPPCARRFRVRARARRGGGGGIGGAARPSAIARRASGGRDDAERRRDAAVRSRDEQIAAMTRLGLINQVAAQI